MTESVRRPLWVVGAALSIGAGVIHFALGPEHVGELGPLGFGFYLSGALQLGWALVVGALLVGVQLLVRADVAPSRPAVHAVAVSGIVINLAILAAWVVSRVVGLPVGEMPWTPEAVGRPDAVAGTLEAVLVVGLVGSIRGWSIGRMRSSRWLAASAAFALSAVVVGTVFAITPDAVAHEDGRDHAMGAMVMPMDAGGPR